MRARRLFRVVAAHGGMGWRALALAVVVAGLCFPAVAVGDDSSAPVAVVALDQVAGATDVSAGVATSSDGSSAMVAQTAGATVDVAADPSQGVTVDPSGAAPPVTISIPNADQASNAVDVAQGIVAFSGSAPDTLVLAQVIPDSAALAAPAQDPAAGDDPAADSGAPDAASVASDSSDPVGPSAAAESTDGSQADSSADPTSATAADSSSSDSPDAASTAAPAPADASAPAAATTGGGVRLLTVITGPDAPTDFPFTLDVPDGGSIVPQPDGGYAIDDAAGAEIAHVDPPWAIDANGADVPVSYTLDGDVLTLHVDHQGAAYPVVADPAARVVPPPPPPPKPAPAPAPKPAPAPAPPSVVVKPAPAPAPVVVKPVTILVPIAPNVLNSLVGNIGSKICAVACAGAIAIGGVTGEQGSKQPDVGAETPPAAVQPVRGGENTPAGGAPAGGGKSGAGGTGPSA